jgi:hypothetical protein
MTLGTLPHIAFIGRAGAGKTTAAELLVKRFGYERLSFAAPLKVACATTTDRTLLQNVGTGVRELCPDFWVNLFIDRFLIDSEATVVVDDCRFPNEAARLAVEGFLIVRVLADEGSRITRLKANGKLQDEAQLRHESETALDKYDAHYTIHNNEHPDHLLAELTTILNKEQR